MIAKVAFWMMALCWAAFIVIIFTYPSWGQDYRWNEYRYDSQGNYETWIHYEYGDGSSYSWGVRSGPGTQYMPQYERRYVPEDPRKWDGKWRTGGAKHDYKW